MPKGPKKGSKRGPPSPDTLARIRAGTIAHSEQTAGYRRRLYTLLDTIQGADGVLFQKQGINTESIKAIQDASYALAVWTLAQAAAGLIPNTTPSQRIDACKTLVKLAQPEASPADLKRLTLAELQGIKQRIPAPAPINVTPSDPSTEPFLE